MSNVEFRRLALEAGHVTSVAALRRGLGDPHVGAGHSLRGMRAAGLIDRRCSVSDAIAAASEWMLTSYRSETVYKNAIANRLLVERHPWDSAVLLSEFRIGTSIADCVIVNGTSTVYEIKTELDHPAKLCKQLEDYQAVAGKVYVVTHRSLARQYLELLKSQSVGVIAMADDGSLRTRKRAIQDTDSLSVDRMIKTLRRAEFTRIAEHILGSEVDVPATQHFRRCREISHIVSAVDYSRLFEGELRRRQARAGAALREDEFRHIRHQLLKVDPTQAQLHQVREWMSGRA